MNEILNFGWNTSKTRTKGLSPVDNRVIIVEVAPIDIVRAPNRHSVESIIDAMCKTLAELVAIQEANAVRILEIQQRMLAPTPPAPVMKGEDHGTDTKPTATKPSGSLPRPKPKAATKSKRRRTA